MMQSIKCCELFRRLSCVISRQRTLMHSCRSSLSAPQVDKLLSNSCRLSWRQHRRLESSLTDKAILSNSQSKLETNDMERGDTADKHQALREELRQMRDLGHDVPENISDADLAYYATLTSNSGRRRCLSFLFKREAVKKKEKLQKMQRKLERSQSREPREDEEWSLPPNKITRRISEVTMLTGDNWRVASAMQFGPQIAYDFSFDDSMVRPEVLKMLTQLNYTLHANKVAKEPFHLHWTGLKEGSMTLRELRRIFPDGRLQNLMVNMTERDVVDVFPREKLIYLTPDSKNIMHSFDVDKVYIVGGLVDSKSIQTGTTLAKAKRYNIDHARIPLDLYLQWESGGKALTLDQVANILHTLQATGDWVEALKNVPARKHGGCKFDRTISDSRVVNMIESPQDLEVYYQRKKREIALGQDRKGSVVKEPQRFSFSRAKREFKWDLRSKSDRSGREGPRRRSDLGESRRNDITDADDDPTGDNSFSSPNNHHAKSGRRRADRKSSDWFED